MKLLAIADTHLGHKAGRTAEARKYIADAMFNSLSSIVQIAKREKYDFVLHGGDVFNRSSPEKREIYRFFNLVEGLLDDDIGFIVAPGNHDRSRLPDSLFRYYYKNYFCFNKFSTFNLGDIGIIGFPFEYKDPRAVFNKVKTIALNNAKKKYIILCHQLFYGATFGPHNFRFTLQNDVIQTQKLPDNLKLVITGHIHKAQLLANGRVAYPGSTERTHHVEIIEPKGYLSIECADDFIDLQFKEVPTTEMKVLE
ncbi:MAG: metallophosphoesterase family protein, partial [Candidatus Kariarchaeaceae archaeon]